MKATQKDVYRNSQHLRNVVVVIAIVMFGVIAIHAHAVPIDHESPPLELNIAKMDSLRPTPDYLPEEVVRLQIEAFAKNDEPYSDAGIRLAFRFASPANRKMTGPLRRFTRIVYNPLYRPMLNHKIAHYGELRVYGDKAIQLVLLTAEDGERVGYLFMLSRQQGGDYDNCWMTDNVLLLPKFQEV